SGARAPASAFARTPRPSRAIRAASCPIASPDRRTEEKGRPAMRNVLDSFAGFDNFLVYLAVSLVLLRVFVSIYIRVTPQAEFTLMREGNMAAAFSLSGAILGFVIPLGAAVRYSVNLVD